jgi:short-subunit dehydrogenase
MAIRSDFKQRYGKWALITGAAQGIGAAYSQRLIELGMPVVILDVQGELLEAQAAKLRAANPGAEVRVVVCDLSDAAAVNAAIDGLAELEIGLLVANAGIGAVGRWLEVPQSTKLTQVAVNCASLVVLADRLTPLMVERKRGGVIIMSSGSADAGSSFIVTYAATKAFDRVFAEGLWLELSPHRIDVTTVMPGATNTEGFQASLPKNFGPTKMMTPGDPRLVVEAALEGLGTKVNVHPAAGKIGAVLGMVMKLIPRKQLLKLGDKAVRSQYDHGPLLYERSDTSESTSK